MRVPLFRPRFCAEDLEAIAEVLRSGYLSTGAQCQRFEEQFAEQLGIENAVSVSSGSAALHLSLAAAGVGAGDRVFVPALGFAADAQAVEWQGATPIFVDSEPDTLCIDPKALRATVEAVKSEKRRSGAACKAVVAVDYAGHMADYAALREVCEEHDMALIEDAAHALPAGWRAGPDTPWQSPGMAADLACFSFYGNKTLTTGEGGMVATRDDALASHIRRLRLHGFAAVPGAGFQSTWTRQVAELGFKYNLSDLAASLGIRQLSQLQTFYEARLALARRYHMRFADSPALACPRELPQYRHSWHLYVVRLNGAVCAGRRNALVQRLRELGVETSVHWYPLHLHQHYRHRRHLCRPLSVVEAEYPRLISLPMFPSMTDKELDTVVNTLLSELDR